MKSLVCVVLLLLTLTSYVQARPKIRVPLPMIFGSVEQIHRIQSVNIPEIKNAYLGYVTKKTHIFWVLGLYTEVRGYAIGEGEESENQGYMLDESTFNELKSNGIIPKNIPDNPSLTAGDILAGFSLWWIGLAIIAGFILLRLRQA